MRRFLQVLISREPQLYFIIMNLDGVLIKRECCCSCQSVVVHTNPSAISLTVVYLAKSFQSVGFLAIALSFSFPAELH